MVQILSWMHSTFKYLSNEYSHAQIRVKMKKLWPRQVRKKNRLLSGKYVATRKVCRDKQYVATSVATRQAVATSVATSSMSRPVSRPNKLSRPVSRQESFVATRNLCRDQKRCRNKKKLKFDIFDQISSPFHPRTIYILVF